MDNPETQVTLYTWSTGTCFIQKIYAPSSFLSKGEEGAYIFWMKQMPVTWRHRRKVDKQNKNATQTTKKINNTDPSKKTKTGVNPGVRER